MSNSTLIHKEGRWEIRQSKGGSKTASIQVLERQRFGNMLRKHYSFDHDNEQARQRSITKAKDWLTKHATTNTIGDSPVLE